MRIIITLVFVAAIGCQPAIPESRFSCSENQDCPENWFCNGGRCASEEEVGEFGPAACSDGLDNDSNGFTDCEDWDCCVPETYEMCESDCADTCPPPDQRRERVISDNIDEDTLWTCAEMYILDGSVSVLAELRILPGTIIRAMNDRSGLVVTRTGRLEAIGERERPIVFTSDASTRTAGDWQGVALFGNAPTHEDVSTNFGGSEPTHDCGTLNYVRIEFAGASQPVRHAGLLLAGCGTETVIDRVQVHRSAANGFAVLGGETMLRRSISTLAQQAGLAYDLGWRGRAQQLAVIAGDLGNALVGSNGNDVDAQPRSSPTLFNITLHGPGTMLGTNFRDGIVFEQGTQGRIRNSIVGEFHGRCATVDAGLARYVTSMDVVVGHSVVHECGMGGIDWSHPEFAKAAWDGNNVHETPFPPLNPNDPEWTPATDSTAATAPRFSIPAEFETLNYVGAFAPMEGSDWSEGWSAYPMD